MNSTNRSLVVVALVCASFLAAMEATAVATAMPTIVGDLGGIHLYAWVFTSYMMSSTVMVPIFGKLADTFGRKPVLQTGILIFVMGSLGSALSRNMAQLIAFRALQGLGAGAIQPIGITIVGDLYEVEERAKVNSVFSAVWAIAGICGPLLGGFIVEYFSWQWIFYINLPFGVLSAVLLQHSLQENIKKTNVTLDVTGACFLAASVVTLLVGVNQPTHSTLLLSIAGILFLGLWITERSTKDPLFPPQLFSTRTMASACAISALLGGTMLATITYLPLYVQGVLGYSGSHAAATIIPMAFGWPTASAVMARLMTRTGYRPAILAGLLCIAGALLIIALSIGKGMPLYYTMIGMGLLGFGLGCTNTPMLIAVQSSVKWAQRGVATASILFFRTIGGTVSVGFLGGILATTVLNHPELPLDAANKLLSSEHGVTLTHEIIVQLAKVLATGLQKIFWVGFVISLLAFAAGFSFPHIAIKARER